jgi:hypothetical protein
MTLGQTGDGYFRVYAANTTDIGKYEVVVTGTLSNLDIFGDPLTTISPALRISKTNPPANFVYTSSFKMFINIQSAPETYSAPNNTSPYFLPRPYDMWMYATEPWEFRFGPAFDNEGDIVKVEPDFGNANFVLWDKTSNKMSVPANATSNFNAGEYPMSIKLTDNKKTSVAYSSDVYYGNITYNFKLTVYNRRQDAPTPIIKPPEVRVE